MILNLRRSFAFVIVAIALTFAYAYLGTGLAHVAFKSQANGSITPSGSTLIGQNWTSPRWFHGRPDDAGPMRPTPRRTSLEGITPLWLMVSPGSRGLATSGRARASCSITPENSCNIGTGSVSTRHRTW